MSESPARTIVIFSVIALVLAGASVGGLKLMKARNAAYARTNTVATQPPQPKSEQKEQPQQPQPSSKDNASQPQPDQNKSNTNSPPSSSQAANKSTQGATSQPSASAPAPANNAISSTGPHAVTATGASDVGVTVFLMMLAAFFTAQLSRVRAAYRRYLS